MRLILVAEASIANGFHNSTRLEGVVEEVVVVGGVLVRDCLDHLKNNEVDYESFLVRVRKNLLAQNASNDCRHRRQLGKQQTFENILLRIANSWEIYSVLAHQAFHLVFWTSGQLALSELSPSAVAAS